MLDSGSELSDFRYPIFAGGGVEAVGVAVHV
jgi:hypothetical protein